MGSGMILTLLIAGLFFIGLIRFFLKIAMIAIVITIIVLVLLQVNSEELKVEEPAEKETKEYTV